jgi:hypothetical protein
MKRGFVWAAALVAGVTLYSAYSSARAADIPDCKDGFLSTFLDTKCKKGTFTVAFNKEFEPSGDDPPAAANIGVMIVANGLIFTFPKVTLAADGDSASVHFNVGVKTAAPGNFTVATLTADPTTMKPGVAIAVDLAPNVSETQVGLGPLDLRGTLMNVTSGTFRTPTPVIKFSKVKVSFDGPVTAAPKFSLQFSVK